MILSRYARMSTAKAESGQNSYGFPLQVHPGLWPMDHSQAQMAPGARPPSLSLPAAQERYTPRQVATHRRTHLRLRSRSWPRVSATCAARHAPRLQPGNLRVAVNSQSRGRGGRNRERIERCIPRGSGWPNSAKAGSCLTAPGRSAAGWLMLNVPTPPGSALSGFSAAGCCDGGGDDGLSSGCRKSCVLRKKSAR
jgi:hypothetical protein